MSSFVLDSYQELLRNHLVVTLFLTMLVGAGGNAGNQSAIKVIRGLVHLCPMSIVVLSGEEHYHAPSVGATPQIYSSIGQLHAECLLMSKKLRTTALLFFDTACSACRQLEGSRQHALPSGRPWHSSALWACCWLQG